MQDFASKKFMNTYLIRFVVLALVLAARCPAVAANPIFSVTIVGSKQGQEHYFDDPRAAGDSGFPLIRIPATPVKETNSNLNQITGSHFYVVVTNTSEKNIRLNLCDSDWYACMEFQIIAPDGKTFSIHRPQLPWAANPKRSWIFQAHGMRIFAVDLTSECWDGLPSEKELPRDRLFKIKAVFKHASSEENKVKENLYESGIIDAKTPIY